MHFNVAFCIFLLSFEYKGRRSEHDGIYAVGNISFDVQRLYCAACRQFYQH